MIIDFKAKMQEYSKEMGYSSLIRQKRKPDFLSVPVVSVLPRSSARRIHRRGGDNMGALRGLNLSFSVGDRADRVAGNRKRVRDLLNLPSLTSLRQVHGTEAVLISKGRGADTTETPETESGDILLTDRPGIGLMINQADCQAVMLVDPRHKALANIHCGWRGNVRGVISEGIKQMRGVFRTNPADLLAAMGLPWDRAVPNSSITGKNCRKRPGSIRCGLFTLNSGSGAGTSCWPPGLRRETSKSPGSAPPAIRMSFIRTGRKRTPGDLGV